MRHLIFFLALFVLIISFSTTIFAVDEKSPNSNEGYIFSKETYYDSETSNTDFLSIFMDILNSTQTIVSAIVAIVLGVYLIIFKKELPKYWSPVITLILLTLTLIARLLIKFKYADIFITIFVIIVLLISSLIIINIKEKKTLITHETVIPKNSKEKKALNVIQNLANKSHSSIECIQLYSFNEIEEQDNIEYNIGFLGGSSKNKVNINAIFSSTISIPKKYIQSISAILDIYAQFDSDNNINKEEQNAISILLTAEIEKIKSILSQINTPQEITATHCYLARILLLYMSLYATIEEHDTYIGLGRDSLFLENGELESELFTFERTGILGAILSKESPYVFSYKKNGNKSGRFYYTFSCRSNKNYIILISMKNKNNGYYIDFNMSKNLNAIEQNLLNVLNSDSDITKKGDDDNEK